MTLDPPAEQPAEPWAPPMGAVRPEVVTSHLVDRRLVNSIIEALGFEPADVAAVWLDHRTVTVIRRRDLKKQRLYVRG